MSEFEHIDIDGDKFSVYEPDGAPEGTVAHITSVNRRGEGNGTYLDRDAVAGTIAALTVLLDAHDAAAKAPKVGDLVLVSDNPGTNADGTGYVDEDYAGRVVKVAANDGGIPRVVRVGKGQEPFAGQWVHPNSLTVIGRALDAEEVGR